MFSPTDNMEAEGDKLNIFLNSCLKQTKHVTEVRKKLDDEGIDYDTLYELHEQDLRSTLKDDLGIKNYRVGLIVKAFVKMDGSGAQTNPVSAGTSGFVILTEKQNDYILTIQHNEDAVKKNIEKLEIATDDINQNAKTVSTQINDHYQQLSNILKQQQSTTLHTLENIKNGKLSMIKKESVTANAALEHLEKSDEDFKRILNDNKLDITKKHGAITQHIEASQTGLEQYDAYLQMDMPLPTTTKIEYDAKNKEESFQVFMQQIGDVIDADISFTKIEFMDNHAVITWQSDLDKINDATFALQFRIWSEDEDEKKEENEWKVLHVLEAHQTKVSLDKEPLGALKALTLYQFRIEVNILNNTIYSRLLTVTTPEFCRLKSSIITRAEERILMKWIPNCSNRKFVLLFDSKIDGFASSTFHTKCDAFGPTISIIQSTNNHIFGGYVEIPWHITGSYSRDNNAWLYSLRNAKGVAKKLDIFQNQSHALYGHNSYGPTYAGNHDLTISDGCNANSSSYVNLGHSYRGVEDPYQLTGASSFQVANYEVWGILEPGSKVMESSILSQQEFKTLDGWIKASGYMHYKLLLRGSVDGFGAAVFHEKCDNKGVTLVIVRSENDYVFGGYTEVSWKHSGYKPDPNAWIYLLRNPTGHEAEQWYPRKNKNSIYAHNSYCATFGSGHDLYLADGCNANTTSYSGLGTTYSAKRDNNKLAGAYNFKVTEYEVWQIC